MTTTFEAGQVRPLFRLGSYDGMMTGVALLNGQHVYLDASEQMGGWSLKARWRELEDLLDELLDDEDSENIWDRLENKYEDQMYEDKDRRFEVRALTDRQFEDLVQRHRMFQLHVGMHCDFHYDTEGRPCYGQTPDDRGYWGNSTEYHGAHFYDALPRAPIPSQSFPLLGHVRHQELFAPGSFRPPFLEDPRSPELKKYQQTWKAGDRVRLEW